MGLVSKNANFMNLYSGITYSLDYNVIATDYSNFTLVIIINNLKHFIFGISNFNFIHSSTRVINLMNCLNTMWCLYYQEQRI